MAGIPRRHYVELHFEDRAHQPVDPLRGHRLHPGGNHAARARADFAADAENGPVGVVESLRPGFGSARVREPAKQDRQRLFLFDARTAGPIVDHQHGARRMRKPAHSLAHGRRRSGLTPVAARADNSDHQVGPLNPLNLV